MKPFSVKVFFVYLLFSGVFFSCKKSLYVENTVTELPYARMVDTQTHPIAFQTKTTFTTSTGVAAHNRFDGARLNDFIQENDSTFLIVTLPENEPINPSPWYCFKVWADSSREIQLKFKKEDFRYIPKIQQKNGEWVAVSNADIRRDAEEATYVKIPVSPDTTCVCAQELYTLNRLETWLNELPTQQVKWGTAGTSVQGRAIPYVAIGKGKRKNLVVLLSRQHPPEVTGQLALEAFVEGIFSEKELLKKFLKKNRILIVPMLNPDGVTLGNWRHNVGGIDLNRDWYAFHQPESRTVSEFIKDFAAEKGDRIVLGMDFHSTWEDVYYTNRTDSLSVLPTFTNQWISAIKNHFLGYEPKVSPSALNQAVTKNWFYVYFNAVGITYEIGDATPRDFIRDKGKFSAQAMMELLLATPPISK